MLCAHTWWTDCSCSWLTLSLTCGHACILLLQFVFMDMGSYEETRLPRDDWAKYLKEGAICYLVFYQSKVSTGLFTTATASGSLS